jgi:hypothetical protein
MGTRLIRARTTDASPGARLTRDAVSMAGGVGIGTGLSATGDPRMVLLAVIGNGIWIAMFAVSSVLPVLLELRLRRTVVVAALGRESTFEDLRGLLQDVQGRPARARPPESRQARRN